eukprot:g11985.t1.2.5e17418b g11985  g11985.t1 contig6:993023-994787(+)
MGRRRPLRSDHNSPGICAPDFHSGGLDCGHDSDDVDFKYCSEPGSDGECGSGFSCYDKKLCPKYSYEGGYFSPEGVCDDNGKGLDCADVTTYCTEPGGHGECGAGRQCHDAGLCGYGGKGLDDYDGVCGAAYGGIHGGGLDCGEVSTSCTDVGSKAECAHGATCFSSGMCHESGKHAGVCGSDDGFFCDGVKTYCSSPGESGQCGSGKSCYDAGLCHGSGSDYPGVCAPKEGKGGLECGDVDQYCTEPGSQGECGEGHTCYASDICYGGDSHGASGAVCFLNGDKVSCSGNPEGDAVYVQFSYSAETSGVDPDDVVGPLEDKILSAVADHVSSGYGGSVTMISSDPSDYIKDDEACSTKYSGDKCSVIKGEMTVYANGHELDACEYADIVEYSMYDKDFSNVHGVEKAEYIRAESSCNTNAIIGSGNAAEDESLGAGAMIGLAMLAAALAAIALLAARRLRRKPATDKDFDIVSLDSNEGRFLGMGNDPFASTVDVHKCTSMYCNCNKGLGGTTFIPAPKKADMNKTLESTRHCFSSRSRRGTRLFRWRARGCR